MEAFTFNSKAKYRPGVQPDPVKVAPSLIDAHITVQAAPARGFDTDFPNVFYKYKVPNIHSEAIVKTWSTTPMQFWQNQINFAVWCATTGCGVSVNDHLNAKNPMTKSLFLFHTYYQIRRILEEIKAPLPKDPSWNPTNNTYDHRAYDRICQEFNISPNTDWRMKGSNKGLGHAHFYWAAPGYIPGDSSKMSSTKRGKNDIVHVEYKQSFDGVEHAWVTFILKTSEGFTTPGVGRLNESIRTYVWAILGAQSQAIIGILGGGAAIEAQTKFLSNVEDAISSPVDIYSEKTRYQDVLQYASSEVNYVFGIGLYMAPSDMLLRIGKIEGYNNNLLIAEADQKVGLNSDVNLSIAPTDASNDTGEIGIVKLVDMTTPTITSKVDMRIVSDHADEKTALIVGGIAIGLVVLWFL